MNSWTRRHTFISISDVSSVWSVLPSLFSLTLAHPARQLRYGLPRKFSLKHLSWIEHPSSQVTWHHLYRPFFLSPASAHTYLCVSAFYTKSLRLWRQEPYAIHLPYPQLLGKVSRTWKALYKDLSGWTKQLQVNADWVIPNVIADSFGHLANIDWGPMMCQALSRYWRASTESSKQK